MAYQIWQAECSCPDRETACRFMSRKRAEAHEDQTLAVSQPEQQEERRPRA